MASIKNIQEKSRQEYMARINRVTDYIDNNLDKSLTLETIAEIASFSPFHFHRVFTFINGETPIDYIQRIRIEKAAARLIVDKISVSEAAYTYGFGSISLFSRTFRKYFTMTPTEYRNSEKAAFSKDGRLYSKNGQMLSRNRKIVTGFNTDLCGCSIKPENFIFMETKIEVKQMPEWQVIYCRHTGPFHLISQAYEKVMKWARPRGLYTPGINKTMTVTHDDPSVTEIEKVRQSACIIVDKDVKVEGEIGKMVVPGGEYAVGSFEINNQEFEKAWNTMCKWFIESGYQQGEGVTYELYHNFFEDHPQKKHIVDICIPCKVLDFPVNK